MDQKLDKNPIFETLQSHKMKLKSFGVNRIGLFGSYFNNKANDISEIDFLVELQKEK